MASLIDAIAIKRKMFFEYEGAPYHCLDVEVYPAAEFVPHLEIFAKHLS
jgi:hypothetical protein